MPNEDEWWGPSSEIEVSGKSAAADPAPEPFTEVDRYRAPDNLTAAWVQKQLTKAEWAAVDKRCALNPHLIAEMSRDAKRGLLKRAIMARYGFHVATWKRWEDKAHEGVQPYALWLQCVMMSYASIEAEQMENVRAAALGDWKAAKWILEQVNKDEYSPTPKTTINVAGDVKQENSVNFVRDEDAVAIAQILQQVKAIPSAPVEDAEIVEEGEQ